MADFDPHFIPCIKHNCENQRIAANCPPCSTCIQGTKWVNFKRAKTPQTFESKDFSFNDMEKVK